jgi:hypothetical protein
MIRPKFVMQEGNEFEALNQGEANLAGLEKTGGTTYKYESRPAIRRVGLI